MPTISEVEQALKDYRRLHPVKSKAHRYFARTSRVLRLPVNETKWAWQRIFRGWDDRAYWSLDHYLCHQLGAQLIWYAENGHSYPGEDAGWTEARWNTKLREVGETLLKYDVDAINYEENMKHYAKAQEALHWVADNLGSLWD